MSMRPSQSKSSTVTAGTSKGAEGVMYSNCKERKLQWKGEWAAAGEGCPLFSFVASDIFLSARHPSAL